MGYRLLYDGCDVRLSAGEHRIGRAADNDIWLDDPRVSRHHATLLIDDQGLEVHDAGSRNGVYVNGARIDGSQRVRPGDSLSVGEHVFVVAKARRREEQATIRRQVSVDEEPLFVLSALADKALALGNVGEAERILAQYLEGLLHRAVNGTRPHDRLIAGALQCAVSLAAATRKAKWLLYVFDLCNATNARAPADLVERSYTFASRLDVPELSAVRDYIATQGSSIASMTPRQRFEHRRVEGLLHLLGG